jgi:hypothetical protein
MTFHEMSNVHQIKHGFTWNEQCLPKIIMNLLHEMSNVHKNRYMTLHQMNNVHQKKTWTYIRWAMFTKKMPEFPWNEQCSQKIHDFSWNEQWSAKQKMNLHDMSNVHQTRWTYMNWSMFTKNTWTYIKWAMFTKKHVLFFLKRAMFTKQNTWTYSKWASNVQQQNAWISLKWAMFTKTKLELTWHDQCSPNKHQFT